MTDFDPTAEERAEQAGGIQYVGEDGEPEEVTPESRDAHLEEKVVDLPTLMTASELLGDEEPLASLPQEPPDDDTPPDDAAPAFIIVPNAFGPGTFSAKRADGTPVGVWLHEEHHELDGGQVAELLILEGMDGTTAAWFGKQRDGRREADRVLAGNPNVQKSMAQEKVRLAQKAAVQAAFIKAQKAKK